LKNHVEPSSQAQRDLRRMGRGSDRDRVVNVLFEELTAVPAPGNLDAKLMEGSRPWDAPARRRLANPLPPSGAEELQRVRASQTPGDGSQGFLVDRVVNRRDLAEAVRNLTR
jgi:hypothetical protein